MAVLVPTRAYYEPLEKVFLDELFLPCCFESSLGYYSRSEVQDLTALIRALSDPDDGISLAHFLSCPFSSLSLEETDQLLRNWAREDLYSGLASSFPEISSKMEKWRIGNARREQTVETRDVHQPIPPREEIWQERANRTIQEESYQQVRSSTLQKLIKCYDGSTDPHNHVVLYKQVEHVDQV